MSRKVSAKSDDLNSVSGTPERRELTHANCPLTLTHVLWHGSNPPPPQSKIYIYIYIKLKHMLSVLEFAVQAGIMVSLCSQGCL